MVSRWTSEYQYTIDQVIRQMISRCEELGLWLDRLADEVKMDAIVLVTVLIKPDGAVGDAKVMRGIDERLDQSALEAIRKWQFKPASRGGEPIAVEALFSIPFQLTGLKP